RSPSFEECLKPNADLRREIDASSDAKRIVDVAQGLEGVVRNNSIHAAAVVIADRPLQQIVPLQLAEDRSAAPVNADGLKPERQYKIVTQYSMGPIEEIGLLKMDFLGLRNLDVIEDAVKIIRRSRDVEIDMPTIPMDDPKTFAMLASGDSVGVFQLESDGMRDALKQVRPTEFDDITALVSLYRPGAMRYIPDYARGKRRPDSVTFPDERLRPITEGTYGCCIYQEQLMEISKQLGGFSPAEADDLRKAIGKKKRDLMATMKDKFLEGCAASGTQRRVADDLWSLMTAAADYSFNKSHAACYALIAYRTAYLKANFPAEYMAAVISSVMSTKDKVPFFVNRCGEMGIEVLPPDVNSSEHGFTVSGTSIRFGLDAVKNVGPGAVDVIMSVRERGGPFESIWDFAERVDARAVNKRAIECLVKCGALDSTGASRRGMLEVLPQAQASGQKAQDDALRGQGSIFDFGDEAAADDPLAGAFAAQRPPVPAGEFGQRELLTLEKETLGTFLSSHPLKEVREALREKVDCALSELEKKQDGSRLTLGGIVAEAKKVRTRSGSYVMFAKLDDLEGQVELFIGDASSDQAAAVELDRVVIVTGRLEHKDRGITSLRVQAAERFEPDAAEVARARKAAAPEAITLSIDAARFRADLITELKGLFETYPGSTEVTLEMKTRDGTRRLRFGDEYRVDPNHGLRAELEQVLGSQALAA
ncbi:MAG: DNA polymerase III subunit alpha, partial [Solirubrobacterales bacterium]